MVFNHGEEIKRQEIPLRDLLFVNVRREFINIHIQLREFYIPEVLVVRVGGQA